ncbi:MAG: IS66 family insertion sequence element accessory protein TnpB [Bacteroidales bacterium]
MFGLGEDLQYYFCIGSTSMNKGIDALSGVVRHQMHRDPLTGEVFIFMSRCRTKIKLLQWQRGGFVLYYKRLERGRFELPFFNPKSRSYCISWQLLFMIIEGITAERINFRPRYTISRKAVNN